MSFNANLYQLSAATCCLAIALGSAPLNAAEPAEGYIVSLDKKELIINLGRENGLLPKRSIELYRRLVVTHPYSNKPIVDRFPIGSVTPSEVGQKLSIVTRWNQLTRAPQRGDIAVFRPPLPTKPDTPKPLLAAGDTKNLPPDSLALQKVFAGVLGQPIADRIRAYEQFIAAFPDSAHVDAVGREVRAMQRFEAQIRTPTSQPSAKAPKPTKPKIKARADQPQPIFVGEDLELVVAVTSPEVITKVTLLVAPSAQRADGSRIKPAAADGWTTVEMKRDGDFYYRAQLPAELAAQAGKLDYYIEAVRDDASFEPIYKSSRQPGVVEIKPTPPGEGAPGRTRVELMGRRVDFNQPGTAQDSYNQFETSISYAVNYRQLRAVTFGVGSLSGGCTLGSNQECLDNEPSDPAEGEARALSLNYAFAEAELGGQWLGLAARLTGGNHQGGVGNTASESSGFELRVRIGEAERTRLVVGIASLDDLGSKGFVDAYIDVLEKIPLKAGVVVTSLPVQSKDWGVQLSAQAGYRITNKVSVQGLLGWNARTINHFGFTVGGGLGLEW